MARRNINQGGVGFEPEMGEDVRGFQTIPQGLGDRGDFVRRRFETFQGFVESIGHQLRGEVYDFEGDKYVEKNTPLINSAGANKLMSQIQAKINPIVIESNLSDEEIRRISLEVRKMIVKQLFLNYEDWEVSESALVSGEIRNIVDHTSFIALKRTWRDKEREHMSPTVSYSEHHVTGARNQRAFKLFGR